MRAKHAITDHKKLHLKKGTDKAADGEGEHTAQIRPLSDYPNRLAGDPHEQQKDSTGYVHNTHCYQRVLQTEGANQSKLDNEHAQRRANMVKRIDSTKHVLFGPDLLEVGTK